MTILIIGYPGSGKSALAEQITAELSPQGEMIYLATMIPYGDEGKARIARHRDMRKGKGFRTVEAPYDVASSLREALKADKALKGNGLESCTVLLECVSNLAANEMFERHTSPEDTVAAVTEDIRELTSAVRDLVIVTNHFEITEEFDEETAAYACAMDRINDDIADIADRVVRL